MIGFYNYTVILTYLSLVSSMVAALKEKRCIILTIVAAAIAILTVIAIILLSILGVAGAIISNMG